MSAFQTVADPAAPVRIVLVGAGLMGRAWMRTIDESPDAELVGVVDLDEAFATASLATAGLTGIPVGTSLGELAARTSADAVVNVTSPAAHLPVSVEALRAGLAVLCEKPVAENVAQATLMAAASDETGQLLMIGQNRRFRNGIRELRAHVGRLGEVGSVVVEFFKEAHFPGFREEMDHVLLLDMAIHHFDAARFVLGSDPVAVYCTETNPGWSWFAHGANATAVFEFEGGATFTYSGSWCSPGRETSWNAHWRVNGERGVAIWDGEGSPEVDYERAEEPTGIAAGPEDLAGVLAEFVASLRTGDAPSTEVHANILSLAMVEAAIRSAETGARVLIADVLAAS